MTGEHLKDPANSTGDEVAIRTEGCSFDRALEGESVQQDGLLSIYQEAAAILIDGHDKYPIWAGADHRYLQPEYWSQSENGIYQ